MLVTLKSSALLTVAFFNKISSLNFMLAFYVHKSLTSFSQNLRALSEILHKDENLKHGN